jgi:predicted ATPase
LADDEVVWVEATRLEELQLTACSDWVDALLALDRLKALPVTEIAARLDDRFRLLTAGPRDADARQQTLRATVDWSYQLLTDAERVLFRRLSVLVRRHRSSTLPAD